MLHSEPCVLVVHLEREHKADRGQDSLLRPGRAGRQQHGAEYEGKDERDPDPHGHASPATVGQWDFRASGGERQGALFLESVTLRAEPSSQEVVDRVLRGHPPLERHATGTREF